MQGVANHFFGVYLEPEGALASEQGAAAFVIVSQPGAEP
jgi:hypothetical protein